MICASPRPLRSFMLSVMVSAASMVCAAGCGAPLADPEPLAEGVLSAQGAEQPFGDAVRGLCRMAVGASTDWVLAPPPSSYRNKGTPNQKLLWRVWYYGWSKHAGTSAQKQDARLFLKEIFDTQVSTGHYSVSANEVLTVSHYQLWAEGVAGARLLALVNHDADILAATRLWWRGEKALYDLLAREGSIDAPGARFEEGQAGPSQLRDVIYAQLTGRPLPGRAGTPTAPWWDDKYNAGAWMIRELQKMGDDIGGARGAGPADLPRLRDPLYVYSRGSDFVFMFPKMRDALEPIFWVARQGGVKSYSPYVLGSPTTSATPAPILSGASLTIVPGVDGS